MMPYPASQPPSKPHMYIYISIYLHYGTTLTVFKQSPFPFTFKMHTARADTKPASQPA